MRILLALVIVAFAIPSVHAQRTELSGTWVAAPSQAPATLPLAPSPVAGARFGLRVAETDVGLTRVVGSSSIASALPIGGAPVATAVPGAMCVGERVMTETAAWDGDGLVLTLIRNTPAGGGAGTEANNRTIYRLEAADRLVVEGTMVQQGERRQVGSVYVRSTETLPPPPPALPVAGTSASIASVAWIGATWTGTAGQNPAAQTTIEERWTPPASGGMMAVSRTLRGAALASFEFLCIAERAGTLVYFAMPNARTPATMFVATEVTPTSVTFENSSHDFPKLIRYARTAEGGLETTIAGAGGARAQTVTLKRSGSAP